MNGETLQALYKVQNLMNEARGILDIAMYGKENVPNEDISYCRKVYNSICKTLDLL